MNERDAESSFREWKGDLSRSEEAKELAAWEEKVRSGKGKNQLRSRLQIAYDKKRALLTPYVSVELYNKMAIEKIRYTAGCDFNITKQHSLGIFYRYQNMKNVDEDDYDPNMHYLGLGYKFKF